MGVAAAEVLSAGPRRSTIEFVTPDRVTYRPELGVLYPSELDTGMRIYVEYDKDNPDLVRVQHRNAALAIIPGRIDRGGRLADRRGGVDGVGAVASEARGVRSTTHQVGQPVVVVNVDLLLRVEVVNRWRSGGYRIDADQRAIVVGGHLVDVDVVGGGTVANLVRDTVGDAGLLGHPGHRLVAGSGAAGLLMGP